MKHKILLLLFLFSLLPSWGWGQVAEVKETIELNKLKDSYEINDPGEYTFKGEYKGTPDIDTNGDPKPVINVAAGLDVTIILNDATIELRDECPLSAKDASKVNLLLKGTNTLTTDCNYPGIWAPERTNCGIIINELNGFEGSLEAKGDLETGYGTPGIGGYYNNSDKKGYITINGGNINAKGDVAAAIGGAINSSGGIIIINGGNITATSEYGAGIGSGENGSESEITINGGTVTATSKSGAGIGDGFYVSGSTFSTGDNGTAFINTSSISDGSYKNNQTTSGIIFDNNKTGTFYGSSVTLADNVTLASGQSLTISNAQTLTIAKGATLTIAQGATLTNNGTIKCDGEINGTIGGDKEVQYAVTYDPNYDTSPKEYIEYIKSGESVPDYNGNRDYYTFAGWFTQSNGGDQVTTITEATTVYAHWEPIDLDPRKFTDIFSSTYGKSFISPINAEMFIDNKEDVGGLKSIVLKSTINDKFKDLHIEYSDNKGNLEGNLIGIPIGIPNDHPSTISFIITANNGATADVEMEYTVEKAKLTITPDPDQKIYEDETPAYTVTGIDIVDEIAFEGSLEVSDSKIIQGTLKLQKPFSEYCNINFDDNVEIIILPGNASDVLATLPSSTNNTYTGSVTFTAPEGFEIALVSSVTKSDAQLAYSNSFVWDKAGTHEVTYSLRRTAGNEQVYEHTVTVTIIKESPPIVTPDEPEDITPVVYNVSLPSVEGIHTDPVAGNYEIVAWGSFIFTITIEEGYRMLSLPVVKVNDSEIAFSSRTDTTFTYKIKYIRTPKDISITGIVKDPSPTANNAIKAPDESWKIMNGVAYITVAKPTVFAVVDMYGNTISTHYLAPGITPIYNLPRMKPLLFWFDKKRAGKVIISNR